VSHETSVHVPVEQDSDALARLHDEPQEPQSETVVRERSHPSGRMPLQSPHPELQLA
jgi:hypothetical protein